MLLKMKRSQKTALGLLAAGVTYAIDEKENKKLVGRLLEKGFAEKTTKKKLAKGAENQVGSQDEDGQSVASDTVPGDSGTE